MSTKKKPYFNSVDTKISFPDMEKKRLAHWYSSGVVDRYLHKNDSSSKYFSFLDGPITANNPMGVHHAWGRTYKDLWQRYKNMNGYKGRFQNGFDCQGLWVEVEVEKELGIRNKKDIENLVEGDKKASIAKFIELCKERVIKFSQIQTEQTKRLGNFMDWENSYYTMSEDNNYMIWHFLKVCHQKGWIYKGKDSVPWCPRCETAISQHEMLTEDYKEAVHESVFFLLPVNDEDFELLVWTTTPWTIPANVAVAVHPDYSYGIWKNKETNKKIVILESGEWEGEADPPKRVFEFVKGNWEKIGELFGNKLIGKKYKGPFDDFTAAKQAYEQSPETFHTIIPAKDLVTPHEGTGLVHIAPGAGTEDYKLGREFNLPLIAPIDDQANYLDNFGFLSGKNAKKHPELILNYLKENGTAIATHHYKHRYPACWRCKTELVWKLTDEWYISMDKIDPTDKKKRTLREQMKDVARKINWMPDFGLERELDWLTNMHDWLISKPNRYWGLALPIYECKKCGNFEVIGGRSELKDRAVEGWDKFEGHTPHKPWIDEVKIKCDKCSEVADRLPDVGNVWLDAGIVPYSTIKDGNIGDPLYMSDKSKWKNWFPADFITESFPGQFKNWFYSMIAMSTVLEKINPFKNVLGFGTLLAEDGRAMHKSWGNSIEFNEGADKIGADVMRLMYTKQNPADNMLFGYKTADETRRQFHLKLWNVYNFFVTYANLSEWKPPSKFDSDNILDTWIVARLNETSLLVANSLDNFKPQAATQAIVDFVDDLSVWYIRRSRERQDGQFFSTTYEVLVKLSIISAPFVPFIADEIFTNLTKEDSVHLSDWPVSGDLAKKEKDIIENMKLTREIVELGHAERKRMQIPVRQPLAKLVVVAPYFVPEEYVQLIKDELNVKSLVFEHGESAVAKFDTVLTPQLIEEARARELIRTVQQKRKEMNALVDQKIDLMSEWIPEDSNLKNIVIQKTLVHNWNKGKFQIKLLK